MFANIMEENAFLAAATVAGSASSLDSPVECSLGFLSRVDSLSSSSLLDSVAAVPTDTEELGLKKRRSDRCDVSLVHGVLVRGTVNSRKRTLRACARKRRAGGN